MTARSGAVWLRHGVQIMWIVDPESEMVEIWQPETLPVVLSGDETLTGSGVLLDLTVPLVTIFAS
jgi:Uma2 family endonuclease